MSRYSYVTMAVTLGVSFILASILFASQQDTQSTQPGGIPLSQAVAKFNVRAMKDKIGKNQPALTEDEVVACIRAWNRTAHPVTDEILAQYQQIADTRTLSKSASLGFHTGLTSEPYHFDVWWIDLTLDLGRDSDGLYHIYSYRLRDRKVRSRLLTAEERKRIQRSRPPEKILKALERFDIKAGEDSD